MLSLRVQLCMQAAPECDCDTRRRVAAHLAVMIAQLPTGAPKPWGTPDAADAEVHVSLRVDIWQALPEAAPFATEAPMAWPSRMLQRPSSTGVGPSPALFSRLPSIIVALWCNGTLSALVPHDLA